MMLDEADTRKEWSRCRPLVEEALRYTLGTHTIEDIEAGILHGHYAVWTAPKSVAITEVHQFPRARFFHIFLAAGDLDELRALVPMWRSFAEHTGCSLLTIYGRRGWERALRDQGWQPGAVQLSLPARTGTLQ